MFYQHYSQHKLVWASMQIQDGLSWPFSVETGLWHVFDKIIYQEITFDL